MISLNKKQEIILKHVREVKYKRQTHKETGVAREKIRKYTRDYEDKLKELQIEKGDIEK